MTDGARILIARLEDLRHPLLDTSVDEFEVVAQKMIFDALPADVTSVAPAKSNISDVICALVSWDMLEHLIDWLDHDSPVFQRIIADSGLRDRRQATEAWLDEVADLGWARAAAT